MSEQQSQQRDKDKKPEWKEAAKFADEQVPGIVAVVRKLQIKRPVFSYVIYFTLDDGRQTQYIRPSKKAGANAEAIGRVAALAEAYCYDETKKDEAAFQAAREAHAEGGKPGHRPNTDPKELAKRKRRQENLTRRRAEDAARAHR